MKKKQIISQAFTIAIVAQISRVMGIVRELLLLKIIGVGPLSDAFLTAFKIPTTLRRILGEGALANTIIPYCTTNTQPHIVSQITTLTLAILEIVATCMIMIGAWYAPTIIQMIAPGFNAEQVMTASLYLRQFLPFVLFISIASLFGAILQAQKSFIPAAINPLILNLFFIGSLLIIYMYNVPIGWVCYSLSLGALIQCCINIYMYYQYGFRLRWWTQEVAHIVKTIYIHALIYLPTISLSELNLFIDTSFASSLAQGTVSLLYYAGRFANIPLSVVIGSFATVLLPSLAQLSPYKNRLRLSFYLHHAIIAIVWITIPIVLGMILFSKQLFITLFTSDHFHMHHAHQAGFFLQLFALGIIFQSINRIVNNIFYASKNTLTPMIIAFISIMVNMLGNYYLIHQLAGAGIAIATSISAAIQMTLSLCMLNYHYKITINYRKLFQFIYRYIIQLFCIGIPFGLAYISIHSILINCAPSSIQFFLIEKLGYWLWVGPLVGLFCVIVWLMRAMFNVHVFFIE